METLSNIGMFLVNNTRSKAYLQYILKTNMKPAYIIFMQKGQGTLFPGQRAEDLEISSTSNIKLERCEYFDADLSIDALIQDFDIPCHIVIAESPNAPKVCQAVREKAGKYMIYSGPGGIILKELLDAGKKLIHVHSGTLPEYRGSTTMYYELLNAAKCAATAIIMARALDAGPVLHSRRFEPPAGVNIDYVYDAHCRATVLVELLEKYLEEGFFQAQKQPQSDEAPYYIIHPALKQIVLSRYGIEYENSDWVNCLARGMK